MSSQFRPLFSPLVFLIALVFASVGATSCARLPVAHDPVVRSPATAKPALPVEQDELVREIEARMFRVDEFAALRAWGAVNGVRVWGAGGTATGLAIYVRQNLENESLVKAGKPPKYFDGRFSYNYFDVYRSTQDADIVIDGSEADAQNLEKFLHDKFAHLQGSKSIWEVRLLNRPRGEGVGEKDPLLGFDFQNQNSDSFSTGMVELTDPPPGESRVRDLFDWSNHESPKFLRDIVEGTITFYRNAKHSLTKRFLAGSNPEILSAIRALTKAFQYESAFSPEDEAELRRIIEAWDPNSSVDSYVANQISKNGQKLFWHSPDVERAWNDLERLGLRKKLVRFGERNSATDLADWLGKEPLRTAELGKFGKTAEELGLDIVAHETNSFLAYENISRSLKGKANVFISRDGFAGEAAVHGDGFYTRVGTFGARGTGLTIRFRLDPKAREGIDFLRAKGATDFIVIRNAAAITVIDESLNLTPLQYWALLARGEFAQADRGMLEKLRYKLKIPPGGEPDLTDPAIVDVIEKGLFEALAKKKKTVVGKYFEPKLKELPYLLKKWLETSGGAKPSTELLELCFERVEGLAILEEPAFVRFPQFAALIEARIPMFNIPTWMREDKKIPRSFYEGLRAFKHPELLTHPKFATWVERAIKTDTRAAIGFIFNQPYVVKHPKFEEWIERLMAVRLKHKVGGFTEIFATQIADTVLKQEHMLKHPKFATWVDAALDAGGTSGVAQDVLRMPGINAHPKFTEWMDRAIVECPNCLTNGFAYHGDLYARHPKFDTWMHQLAERSPIYFVQDVLIKGGRYVKDPRFSSWFETVILKNPSAGVRFLNPTDYLNITTRPEYFRWLALFASTGKEKQATEKYIKASMAGGVHEMLKYCPSGNFSVECLGDGYRRLHCQSLLR